MPQASAEIFVDEIAEHLANQGQNLENPKMPNFIPATCGKVKWDL